MSVYVDRLMKYAPEAVSPAARRTSARHEHHWCHMIADTEAELHVMAARIGMRRAWFQGDHYDLVESRRLAAISAGAVPLDRRAFVDKLREIRGREVKRYR